VLPVALPTRRYLAVRAPQDAELMLARPVKGRL
jgi:hypothetical protein